MFCVNVPFCLSRSSPSPPLHLSPPRGYDDAVLRPVPKAVLHLSVLGLVPQRTDPVGQDDDDGHEDDDGNQDEDDGEQAEQGLVRSGRRRVVHRRRRGGAGAVAAVREPEAVLEFQTF
jgi:hypothetical protein